ncbi:hypothetical protein O6H91_Y015700 [Diphasiastrum complanatum]|nr:hypothetical protein O6H91_Y015700 [Diphasiastrum complanatum]
MDMNQAAPEVAAEAEDVDPVVPTSQVGGHEVRQDNISENITRDLEMEDGEIVEEGKVGEQLESSTIRDMTNAETQPTIGRGGPIYEGILGKRPQHIAVNTYSKRPHNQLGHTSDFVRDDRFINYHRDIYSRGPVNEDVGATSADVPMQINAARKPPLYRPPRNSRSISPSTSRPRNLSRQDPSESVTVAGGVQDNRQVFKLDLLSANNVDWGDMNASHSRENVGESEEAVLEMDITFVNRDADVRDVITSSEQYKKYHEEFSEKYPIYLQLDKVMKSYKKCRTFREPTTSCMRILSGSRNYVQILQKIREEFEIFHNCTTSLKSFLCNVSYDHMLISNLVQD